MEQTRVGVIGIGRMGRNHCRVYSTLRHADLVGIYDRDSAAAEKVARQFETRAYYSVDELLDNVDAVSVATPTPTHFALAMHSLWARQPHFRGKADH